MGIVAEIHGHWGGYKLFMLDEGWSFAKAAMASMRSFLTVTKSSAFAHIQAGASFADIVEWY